MPTDTRRAIVRASRLLAIEPFQSTEETRYYLNGVHIVPHELGALLVATNGHYLVTLLDRDAKVTGLPAIWHPEARLRIGKQIAEWRKECVDNTDRDFWVDLQCDGATGNGTFTITGAETPAEVLKGASRVLLRAEVRGLMIDGTYPEWHRVMPDLPRNANTLGLATFQSPYLKMFGDLCKALG